MISSHLLFTLVCVITLPVMSMEPGSAQRLGLVGPAMSTAQRASQEALLAAAVARQEPSVPRSFTDSTVRLAAGALLPVVTILAWQQFRSLAEQLR